MEKVPLAKLFQGGELYCPEYRGKGDILVVGEIIVRIAPKIPVIKDFLDVEIIEARDRILAPGFVDQHVHIIGAAGGGGPVSRTREIRIQQVTQAGVTTLVGCLGFDNITRDLKRLLVKARGLDHQGITTYIYSGSYLVPSDTLMGSIEKDLLLIDKVLGVKLALGEVAATDPEEANLKNLIIAARRGGLLSGKAGVVHIHMGDRPAGWYKMVARVLQETMIPLSQVIFTHVGRTTEVFEGAMEFGKKGGMLDVTAVQNPALLPPGVAEERKAKGLKGPSEAIEKLLAGGVPQNQITISSDSNAGGLMPDGKWHYGSITSLHRGFRDLAESTRDLPLALKMVTLNPATRLGIVSRKGTLEEGKDADIVVMTRDLQIQGVFARGRRMVQEGEAIVKDPYE